MERILIIDDDEFIRKLLSIKLSRYNYDPTSVSTLKEAEREFQTHTFSFAVVDLNLPGEGQGASIRWCENHNIPLVVLSGSSQESVYTFLEQTKVLGYIDKTDPEAIPTLALYLETARWIHQQQALVVNSSRVQAGFYTSLLSDLFQTCHQASTAQRARELLEKQTFALILVNRTLPDIPGEELLMRIHQEREESHSPVLILTTSNEEYIPENHPWKELVLFKSEPVVLIKNRILHRMALQREEAIRRG